MSPATASWSSTGKSFPRVSGDEPVPEEARRFAQVFSPRERG